MPVQVEVIWRQFSYTKNCFLTLIRNLNSRISLLRLFYQAFFQACHHLSLRVGILHKKSKTASVSKHLHSQVICDSGKAPHKISNKPSIHRLPKVQPKQHSHPEETTLNTCTVHTLYTSPSNPPLHCSGFVLMRLSHTAQSSLPKWPNYL